MFLTIFKQFYIIIKIACLYNADMLFTYKQLYIENQEVTYVQNIISRRR